MNINMYKYECPRWYGMVTGVSNVYSPENVSDEKIAEKATENANKLSGSKSCKVHLLQQFELEIKSIKNHAALASIPLFVDSDTKLKIKKIKNVIINIMVEKITKSDVEEVLTIFCGNIIDKYTLNLEKIKSIEIIATESDTDSERDQSERITHQARIDFNFNKLIQDLPSDKIVQNLVDLFDNKYNFTQKQKQNNFVRMKSRMKNILTKIKNMTTTLEIDESTSISEIKEIMTKNLVKIFIDSGIMDQLKNTMDELRPYKYLGIFLGVIIIVIVLIKLIGFLMNLYQKYGGLNFKFFDNFSNNFYI